MSPRCLKTRSFAFAAVLWAIFVVAQVHHAAAQRAPAVAGVGSAAP